MSFLRLHEAAELLEIAPPTLRLWCNQGKISYHKNVAGQRVFDKAEIEEYKRVKLGIREPIGHKIFYTRTSNKQDVSLSKQHKKLVEKYGSPDISFTDNASGLNENRTGLNQLLKYVYKNNGSTVYITNKDRLTRFGYKYLAELFQTQKTNIVILDDDETKEPLEVLLQDFMSLLASFSGKFYRLRGWTQRKKFLSRVETEVEKHVKE